MSFLNDNFISAFFVQALNWIVLFIKDYALAIILLKLAIRFILIPLDIRQRKSSRKMALVADEMKGLQKRYANNPEQLNQKTRALYKENGISPLAGCLPMLIQLPLLMAFYGSLRVIACEQSINVLMTAVVNGAEAVRLPSWLWIHNFWQPDSGMANILPSAAEMITFIRQNGNYITPQTLMLLQNSGILSFTGSELVMNTETYGALVNQILQLNGLSGMGNGWFILPLVAGGSLFFQQRLMQKDQPATMQQQNKFMMYFFPIFSAYICITSTSAFAIYWIASNAVKLASYLIFDAVTKAKEKKSAPQIIMTREELEKKKGNGEA